MVTRYISPYIPSTQHCIYKSHLAQIIPGLHFQYKKKTVANNSQTDCKGIIFPRELTASDMQSSIQSNDKKFLSHSLLVQVMARVATVCCLLRRDTSFTQYVPHSPTPCINFKVYKVVTIVKFNCILFKGISYSHYYRCQK